MSGLNAFLSQNAIEVENEKYIVSDRFVGEDKKPIPWEIKSIDAIFDAAIRKSCTTQERDKKTRHTTEKTDYALYVAKLITECVVFPNLKDGVLQESYGVMGAESLVKKMLTAGEYSTLSEIVQEVNGFDKDVNELVEDVKN